ncbi:unnamed protein product [Didymodactylos carnosus]|uniref:Uncharacterized protein n=1 Tax=Didymodactylos carnosus TaxID=1234261 RepID=A0A814QXR6_9BILA|nr:unnamed protein product [Didymodactylos carnosus]CAF1425922.1 unnamed protein product [Didymodactylos carnosus]CAF3887675.1 unnamed protein product [Didymodactylos carnosus]CAF4225139.1 unnamed protein product [Didymodactylos carnosus]
MADTIHSYVMLCRELSFSEEKTRDPQSSSEEAKFLSSLALILNGNQQYTPMYVHEAEKTILVARNEKIRSTDKRYFDRFFRQIRTYAGTCFDRDKATTTAGITAQLRSLIFEYNSEKIVNRFEASTQSQSEAVDRQSFYTQYLEGIDNIEQNHVPNVSLMKLTDQQLLSATGIAVLLYESRLFQYMLNNFPETASRGVYYFEKISAHYRSTNLLLKCLISQKDRYLQIYKVVSWKIVEPIKEKRSLIITPRKAFENIWKDMFESTSSPSTLNLSEAIDRQSFYTQHLEGIDNIEQNHVPNVCLHAEILLIDFLLKNSINETINTNDVEIGISKMSCLPCSYYIEELNKKYSRFFCLLGSTHGKTYPKWTYRNNEDSSILNVINEKLIDKVKQSIKRRCLQTNRAGPVKSGDSDIMHTSLGEDEFDSIDFDIIRY